MTYRYTTLSPLSFSNKPSRKEKDACETASNVRNRMSSCRSTVTPPSPPSLPPSSWSWRKEA